MSKKDKILVVDDEINICLFLSMSLNEEYEVFTANTISQAEEVLSTQNISLALVDLMLGNESGLDLLRTIKSDYKETNVIMITAFGDIETSVKSIQMGAMNYLQKPINVEELKVFINQALEYKRLNQRLNQLNVELGIRNSYGNMVGKSQAMQKVYGLIDRLKDVDVSVLVSGESGTGKELVAKAIHYSGVRKNKPFVVINCAAIPEGLLEEELFGHKKGAFTGAYSDNAGKLELADGGTFFLDEVSELPLGLQSKLLRVIQEKETRPIGGSEYKKIDVRFIAATNQNLFELVEKKQFRQDLFYRLNVVEVKMPPLRERKPDIPILCDEFLKKAANETGREPKSLSKEAEVKLMEYDFPGNVRELINAIEYSAILCDGEEIEEEDLPENIRLGEIVKKQSPGNDQIIRDYLSENTIKEIEKDMIRVLLNRTEFTKKNIADRLGISERSLYNKLNEYGF